jgi:hypothetical protein
MLTHLGVQNRFGQRFPQIIDQAIGVEVHIGIGAGQQLVEDGVGNTRF